jgi:hypothetical protein
MNLKSEIGQMNPDLWRFGQIKTPCGQLKQSPCHSRLLCSVVSAFSVNSVLIPILLKFGRDHE